MLSYEQVMFFNAFGYLHLRERFTKDEMATIRREAEEIWYEQVPGFDGKEFVNLSPFAERRPFLSQLVDDDRLYDIPEGILGADFLFQVTEGCVRVGDTPWHGGGHTQSPLPHIKVSVYLDSLDRNNGCLRVLPGSHRNYLNLIDKRWAEAPDPLQPLRRRNTDPGYMAARGGAIGPARRRIGIANRGTLSFTPRTCSMRPSAEETDGTSSLGTSSGIPNRRDRSNTLRSGTLRATHARCVRRSRGSAATGLVSGAWRQDSSSWASRRRTYRIGRFANRPYGVFTTRRDAPVS